MTTNIDNPILNSPYTQPDRHYVMSLGRMEIAVPGRLPALLQAREWQVRRQGHQ